MISRSASEQPVHPRIRGERQSRGKDAEPVAGSSPHTRGTRALPCACRNGERFIPAYAGNAHRGRRLPHAQTVHPRIRGERPPGQGERVGQNGSSPHTRGTPDPVPGHPGARRFIPAYAGNARANPSAGFSATVHPRIRGERYAEDQEWQPRDGSSPHTRGTHRYRTRGIAA